MCKPDRMGCGSECVPTRLSRWIPHGPAGICGILVPQQHHLKTMGRELKLRSCPLITQTVDDWAWLPGPVPAQQPVPKPTATVRVFFLLLNRIPQPRDFYPLVLAENQNQPNSFHTTALQTFEDLFYPSPRHLFSKLNILNPPTILKLLLQFICCLGIWNCWYQNKLSIDGEFIEDQSKLTWKRGATTHTSRVHGVDDERGWSPMLKTSPENVLPPEHCEGAGNQI